MKSAWFLVLTLVLGCPFIQATQNYPQQDCSSNKIVICKDCNSYSVCANGNEILRANCASETPNCVQGALNDRCSESADPNYCTPNEKFICSSLGVFPDPLNCDEYHHCVEINSPSNRYKCPVNYVFDHRSLNCRQKYDSEDCIKVNCSDKFPDKIFSRYDSSKKYYALCGSGSKPDIQMFKCSDGAFIDFKANQGEDKCIFDCFDVGKFADSNDPTAYYECYTDVYKGCWNYVQEKCPSGMVFNPDSRFCEAL